MLPFARRCFRQYRHAPSMPPNPAPEFLEPRIAPATLLPGGKAVTYLDGDGDLVTVKTSKGIFLDPSTPGGAAQFTFGPTATGTGEQLKVLDLSGSAAFDGTNLTITATPSDVNHDGHLEGDGLVNVGYIKGRDVAGAVGIDFGAVLVRGDLGAIDAGDNSTDPAIKSLTVLSLGVEGLTTGAPDLQSEMLGGVGSIHIAGDMSGASIAVFGSAQGGAVVGNIGSITIGGSLLGSAADDSGALFAVGAMKTVKIGGGIFGGTGKFSGLVQANTIDSISVDGTIVGGSGQGSGGIFAMTTLGKATTGGALFGGSGPDSGRIAAQKIGTATIGGSVIGGKAVDATLTGQDSGLIYAFTPATGAIAGAGTLGAVKIGGTITGGSAEGGGAVAATVSITSVTVSGAVQGGDGKFSGTIGAPTVGAVKIGGSLFGGGGDTSGAIIADTLLKSADISGSVLGGGGNASGAIRAGGNTGPIHIGGSVFGGGGVQAGAIFCQTNGNFSTIAIGGHLEGGAGQESAEIFTPGSVNSITIGGSLVGGTDSGSGMIRVGKTLGTLSIAGNVIGGNANTTFVTDSGYVVASHIGSVSVGGTIFAGDVTGSGGQVGNSGAIRAVFDIGSLTVRGSLVGSNSSPVIISAGGAETPGATDVAMKSIHVDGLVFNAKVLAGYAPDIAQSYLGKAVNADAQIGSVFVGGDWRASDLIAGLAPGADGFFGDATDVKISGTGVRDSAAVVSKIGSIVFGGRALGTTQAASAFHAGIGAEYLASLKVGGTSIIPLQPGAKNDLFATGRAYALGGTQGTGVPDGFDLHAFEV